MGHGVYSQCIHIHIVTWIIIEWCFDLFRTFILGFRFHLITSFFDWIVVASLWRLSSTTIIDCWTCPQLCYVGELFLREFTSTMYYEQMQLIHRNFWNLFWYVNSFYKIFNTKIAMSESPGRKYVFSPSFMFNWWLLQL